MHQICHIKIKKFKIISPKTAGAPKIADADTVYGFKAILSPVNFRIKYKISKRQTPIKLLNSKNLIGFRLKTAKIKSVKAKTANKIIAPYLKKVIKSPNIIVMIKFLKNARNLKTPPKRAAVLFISHFLRCHRPQQLHLQNRIHRFGQYQYPF